MQTDPLQQLRDIHLPADPSWWPPAFGWWLLLFVVVAVAAWLTNLLLSMWRKRAPIRSARKIYNQLHENLSNQQIDPTAYCHQCNEVLKRLLVHGLDQKHLAATTGHEWLKALDAIVQTTEFTAGPGSQLGVERFQREFDLNPEGLHQSMQKLLRMVRP